MAQEKAKEKAPKRRKVAQEPEGGAPKPGVAAPGASVPVAGQAAATSTAEVKSEPGA